MTSGPTPVSTPVKPWDGFPLHWHKSGRWRKKYRGRHYYFEADPIKSYDAWKLLEKALVTGETTEAAPKQGYNLQHAMSAFLHHQHNRFTAGKIGPVQMGKYVKEIKTELPKAVSDLTRLSDFCDAAKAPRLFKAIHDAAIARGLQAAERHITYVLAMFNLVSKPGPLYMMAPPMYGDDFTKPTQGQIERDKFKRASSNVVTIWSFEEASQIIMAGVRRDIHLYAMCVLMAVGGYTSADVAAVPLTAIDRKNGMINFPRVKNFRRRLCPLIPPVLNAINESLKHRAEPADPKYASLLFLTREGTPLNLSGVRLDDKGHVTKSTRKDVLNLRLRRLCVTLDKNARDAAGKDKKKVAKLVPLRRRGQGQKIFRTLNYRAAIGSGVHDDFIAVLRGRRFNRPIEDYYLRNDLRGELEKLALHIAKTFKIPNKPPVSAGALRYAGPHKPRSPDQ